MSVFTEYSTGAYSAGKGHFAIMHKYEQKSGKSPGVLFCHSSASDGWKLPIPGYTAEWPNLGRLLRTIAEHGFIVMVPELIGAAWGNDASLTLVTDAWTYMKNTLGAKTDKVILLGHSMGQFTACNWAKRNPTLVKGLVGLQPASDGTWLYNNGAGANMDAAYSPSNWAAVDQDRDPLQFAAVDLASFKHRAYYAPDDTTIAESTVHSLKTAWGANSSTHGLHSGNHTDSPLANIPTKDLIKFLKSL